MGVGGQCRRA
uniref:Uncharacterized protein n=1 Tax=Anguilla anguilla TaxID=7936 RepID=A0A0E9VSS9_ANGAN